MARRIYAGADFFLMPSRFEPCGTGQMISLRYGTPPIVRRTGGLADSVVDERTRPGEGTGFAFDAATPAALAEACEAAIAMRATGGAAWDGLIARGMAVDFDWERGSAPRYLELYERALAIRRGSPGTARDAFSPAATPPGARGRSPRAGPASANGCRPGS
jgi:starch synthase